MDSSEEVSLCTLRMPNSTEADWCNESELVKSLNLRACRLRSAADKLPRLRAIKKAAVAAEASVCLRRSDTCQSQRV
jgi:hypothetical protein